MKITVERSSAQEIQPPLNPFPPSDLSHKPSFLRKPPRRKTKTHGGGVRLRREPVASPTKRRSRSDAPLLSWKFDEGCAKNNSVEEEKSSGEVDRRIRAVVSARKLAAGLWRLHLSEFQSNVGPRLGLQSGGASIHCHHVDRVHTSPVHSPLSVSGQRHTMLHKFEPSFQFPNSAMEGATKWDPDGWRTSDIVKQIFGRPTSVDHGAVISALEAELEQARARINELETERRSAKKKHEQFLQKLTEERAAWRSREHERIRAIIDDMKSDLSREMKNRQRLEIVNSKLVNELGNAKLSAKRYLQEYDKERKARQLIEEVCNELAKEIGEDKAEVEVLKRESIKHQEEVEEERKMLQMAEVWREERVQMKLVDAKVMLEDKYSHMNKLIADLESFISSISDLEGVKNAEFLRQAAASVNIQDIRELTYEPPNSDDIFSVFEDVNFGESHEREVEPYSPVSHTSNVHTVSPQVKMVSKDRASQHSNVYNVDDWSEELEEDASEWETVSHPKDQGSSCSPERSDHCADENVEEEISEVESTKMRQLKKVSSISKLWRSYPNNGDNYKIISIDGKHGRLSNGRLSNMGAIVSLLDDAGGCSPQEWSSPDSGNPRAMKGCIEWPRSTQKNSLKARLLEARMESQKIQLRQVLKHKI